MNCEICNSPAYFWNRIKGYDHFLCSYCRHIFVYPRPNQQELDTFYQQGSYYDLAERQARRIDAEARERLKLLRKLTWRFGIEETLLDVGCASGYFLKAAIEAQWNATGVDRSEAVAQRALSQSGAKVLVGIIENLEIPHSPFPVVTAWEVIEHAVEPRSLFAALAKNVAPNGLLAISTPLANGLPARVLGARFPMLIPPEHLSIFTRKSLIHLAREFGFEEVDYKSFSALNAKSLASGICAPIFGKSIHEVSVFFKAVCYLLALVGVWVPKVVDILGYGTEMQVILRRIKS